MMAIAGREHHQTSAVEVHPTKMLLIRILFRSNATRKKPDLALREVHVFDLSNDPYEQTDLAAKLPDEVARLKSEYETWFQDVTKLGFDPPRIVIGNDKEKVTRLSRQDWRGPKASWASDGEGYWEVEFERPGRYRVEVISRSKFNRFETTIGDDTFKGELAIEVTKVETSNVVVKGPLRVSAKINVGGEWRAAEYLQIGYKGEK